MRYRTSLPLAEEGSATACPATYPSSRSSRGANLIRRSSLLATQPRTSLTALLVGPMTRGKATVARGSATCQLVVAHSTQPTFVAMLYEEPRYVYFTKWIDGVRLRLVPDNFFDGLCDELKQTAQGRLEEMTKLCQRRLEEEHKEAAIKAAKQAKQREEAHQATMHLRSSPGVKSTNCYPKFHLTPFPTSHLLPSRNYKS